MHSYGVNQTCNLILHIIYDWSVATEDISTDK